MKLNADTFPDVLRIAFKAGGIEAVIGLATRLGGKNVYIPRSAGPSHPLVVAGGRKAADAIMAAHHTERIQFPKGGNFLRHLMAAEALNAEGGSLDKAVAASGLHVRSVGRLRARMLKGEDVVVTIARKRTRPSTADTRQIDIEEFLKTV